MFGAVIIYIFDFSFNKRLTFNFFMTDVSII